MSTLGAENLELSQYNNLNHDCAVTFVDLTYFPDISSRILMNCHHSMTLTQFKCSSSCPPMQVVTYSHTSMPQIS